MTKSMCIAVQLSKFFSHYSQLHNERLLEKSQNPREIQTCSLPIARHKCWQLCHRDVIEQSWTVEYIRMRLNKQRRAIFKIIDVFVMCCEAPLRLCVQNFFHQFGCFLMFSWKKRFSRPQVATSDIFILWISKSHPDPFWDSAFLALSEAPTLEVPVCFNKQKWSPVLEKVESFEWK